MKTCHSIKAIIKSLIVCLILSFTMIDVNAAATPARGKKPVLDFRTDKTIRVKWSKSKNAKKYQLAYKKSGGKWKNYKKTTKKILTVSSLKANTKYYFRVRGINGKKYGKWSKTSSAIKTFSTPGKVTGPYPSLRTIDNIEMTWNKVKNAKWYDISIKEVNTKQILTEQQAIENSYSFENWRLYPNTWYLVKVRAVITGSKGIAKGAWTSTYVNTTHYNAKDNKPITITGAPYENGYGYKYQLEGYFTMNQDEVYIPEGYYYTNDPSDPEYFETDTLSVDGVYLLENEEFGTYSGKLLKVGDTYEGNKVISIVLYPGKEAEHSVPDIQQTDTHLGYYMSINFDGHYSIEYEW